MPRRSRRAIALPIVLLAAGCAAGLGGCRRPLLTQDEDRSQFDRYRAVRETREPSYLMDEFGRRQPNLRGRLLEER